MPEFRVNWKDSLNRALGNLGIVSAFDPNEADLKFMLPNAERAFVKKVGPHEKQSNSRFKGTASSRFPCQ